MTPVALIGAIGLIHEASPVVMTVENRSPTPLELTVGLSRQKPLWTGRLMSGASARGAGKARGDDHFVVRCRPPGGPERVKEFGYVTHGFDQRATFVIRSCDDIGYDQVDLMLP